MTGIPPNAFMIRFYRLGMGLLMGKMILLLTTTGRRTGLARTIPLQYETEGNTFVVVSAGGMKADWVRNIQADERIQFEIGRKKAMGKAELVTDAERICDFLELRLKRHPLMVGTILHSDGLPSKPGRSELLAYSGKLVMVILHPD